MSNFPRRFVSFVVVAFALLVFGIAGTQSALAQNQGGKAAADGSPIVIINAASFDRLMNQAVATFEAAGRPELAETIGGGLARVNDLKGLSRNQSIGVMIYLSGFSPSAVVYVPVNNIDDLLKTAEVGPVTSRKVGENRYELKAQRATFHVKLQGDFAFVSNDETAVDHEFPDPAQFTKRFSSTYDLSAAISLKGIDPNTRKFFYNVIKNQAENDLQRRDNEPETAFEIRRAEGERMLQSIEILLNQGDEILVGWTVSQAEKVAALEFVITATPGSEYASYFSEIKGIRSKFSNLINTKNPVSVSSTWKLDKPSKKAMRTNLNAVQKELLKGIGESNANEDHPIRQMIKVLDSTVAEGNLDMIVQMAGTPPGPFSVVGGAKLNDTDILSNAISEVLEKLKDRPGISAVRTKASTHNGVDIHRIDLRGSGENRERVFGGPVSIYLAVDQSILWFAVGSDNAQGELKKAMDKVAEPQKESITAIPFQMVVNFGQWAEILDPNGEASGFGSIARRSFTKGGDALRIEALPVTDGMRVRIQFDEAFLRLAGSAIAEQLDKR